MKTFAKLSLLASAFVLTSALSLRAQDPAASATVPGTSPAQVAPADSAPAHVKGGGKLHAVAAKRLQELDSTLALTDAQKTQIKGIWAKGAADLKGATRADRRTAMTAMHDQVRAVLTPDQQAKFDAMPAEGRKHAKKDTQ